MLNGDQARLRLAYSLQFTLPGTPVLRYGEEIGMGDDLSLPDRESIRTPMQWANRPGAGFTDSDSPVRPLIADGEYGYPSVNAADQRVDGDSLLSWFQRMIHTTRECPEIGAGVCTPVPVDPPGVLVHRMSADQGTLLFVHNLGADDLVVDVGRQPDQDGDPVEVFSDRRYAPVGPELTGIEIGASGFRWLRLSRRS
jgi:maltose alpha-D-glucosyltransferase/alpha-amylase